MQQKQKILYVITKSGWGGAQRYVYDLATHLPRDIYDVAVVFGPQSHTHSTGLKERLESKNVRTITVPHLERDIHLSKEILAEITLYKLFRKERPAVVHLNSSKAGGLGALAGRLARVPHIVFTIHGWAFREERGTVSRFILRFLSWLTGLFAHQLIAVSESDARDARTMVFVQNKVVTIPIATTPPVYKERDAARTSLKRLCNRELTDEYPWIGTIAELHKNKGLEYLIGAIALLKSKSYTFKAVFLGEGEEREKLEALIKKYMLEDSVFLPGFVPDGATYLHAFDIFTLTSIKEGLPYTLLEAGYAHLSTIATAVGGIPEVITDMRSGILVREKNRKEIAHALTYLIEHPHKQKEFGDALYEIVAKKHSVQAMLERTKALYKNPKITL